MTETGFILERAIVATGNRCSGACVRLTLGTMP